MGAKWKIKSRLLVVCGRRRWVWIAVSPPSPFAPVPSLSSEAFLFRTFPSALDYVLEQIESPALAEATA